MTIFEAIISVFNKTYENNSFSIDTPGYWRIPNYLTDGIIDKLKELLDHRSQNNIELHAEEVKKRGTRIEMENTGYNLSSFDLSESEILRELGRK